MTTTTTHGRRAPSHLRTAIGAVILLGLLSAVVASLRPSDFERQLQAIRQDPMAPSELSVAVSRTVEDRDVEPDFQSRWMGALGPAVITRHRVPAGKEEVAVAELVEASMSAGWAPVELLGGPDVVWRGWRWHDDTGYPLLLDIRRHDAHGEIVVEVSGR